MGDREFKYDLQLLTMDGTYTVTVDREEEIAAEKERESKETKEEENGARPVVEKEVAIPTGILKPSASMETKDRNKWV